MHPAYISAGYRTDIDGMRALAVLGVVLFHAHVPGFDGGYVGVDIFFVISGYLITSILLRELDSGQFSIGRFYLRRIRRILPALVVVLIATSIASMMFLAPDKLAEFGRSVIATSLFYSNIFFSFYTGYFDGRAITRPLLHTWSLGVEEQFYIIWPVFLYVAYRAVIGKGRLICLVVILALASLALAQWKSGGPSASRYFFLPQSRMWELMIGSVVAFRFVPVLTVRWRREAVAGAGLAMMLIAVVAFQTTTPFPSLWTLIPCLGAAFVIHAGLSGETATSRLLSFYPLVFIGLISYSLYLWHWPIFVFAHILFDRPIAPAETAALIALSLLLSVLSWWFVEMPFRRTRTGRSYPARVYFAGAAAALAVTAGAGLVMHATRGLPQRLDTETQRFYAASQEYNPLRPNCHTEGIAPPPATKCIVPATKEKAAGAEASSDARQAYHILVWGDSQADALFPGAAAVAEKYGLRARQATKSGCPPLVGAERISQGREASVRIQGCKAYNAAMLKMLENEKHRPDLVMLTGRWTLFTGNYHGSRGGSFLVDEADKSLNYNNSRRVLHASIERTVKALNELGIAVMLIGQSPEFEPNPNRCYVKNRLIFADVTLCVRKPREVAEKMLGAYNAILSEAAGRTSKTVFLRLDDLFCDKDYCWAVKDKIPLFNDGHHISSQAALQIAGHVLALPELRQIFEKSPGAVGFSDPQTVRLQ